MKIWHLCKGKGNRFYVSKDPHEGSIAVVEKAELDRVGGALIDKLRAENEQLKSELLRVGEAAALVVRKMGAYRSTLFRLNGTSAGESTKIAEQDRMEIEELLK